MSEFLPEHLKREQTRHLGEVAVQMQRVADSMASSANINDSIQDVSGNCAAVVTCLGGLQATTAGLVAEVQTLAEAVRDNTAAIQAEGRQSRLLQAETNAVLTRSTLALEGRQAARERPGDVPPPDNPPPPEAPPRQLRPRSLGTRRSPRQGR